MDIGRVRELGDGELLGEGRKIAEQLFRIRFQMKLGQTEGVKRLRGLRKDIARLKTAERERALGIRGATAVAGSRGAAQRNLKGPRVDKAKVAMGDGANKKEVS